MSKRMVNVTQSLSVLSLAAFLGLCAVAPASAADAASPGTAAVEKAAKDNKYLFIFFWRDDTQQSRAMRGVLRTAMAKWTDAAESIELQVADPAEKQLVERYAVSRAPMPLVLAIAPNGAITKGFPIRFDENQLRQAFVSSGTTQCMKALQNRKLVLLCVQPERQEQAALPKGVLDFTVDQDYAQSTKVVIVNPSDAAETSFLKGLQVDPQTATPVTVLMSPPGAVVGTFAGEVTKDQLVAKLKSAQSGCCPGGKCGPNGCAPKN